MVQILVISQACLKHISSISQVYLRCISGIFQPNSQSNISVSGLSQCLVYLSVWIIPVSEKCKCLVYVNILLVSVLAISMSLLCKCLDYVDMRVMSLSEISHILRYLCGA